VLLVVRIAEKAAITTTLLMWGHAAEACLGVEYAEMDFLAVPTSRSRQAKPVRCSQGRGRSHPMSYLSANFVPSIKDRVQRMLLGEVVAVKDVRQSESDRQEGTVSLRVIRVIHGPGLNEGDVIDVPFDRMADPGVRVRNRFNMWNVLRLEPGELILIACRPGRVAGVWTGEAARQVTSENSRELMEVSRAYEIDEFTGPRDEKLRMLAEALVEGKDILRAFAVDYLGRRGGISRAEGTELLIQAISSQKLTPEARLDLAVHLIGAPFFDSAKGADATNQRIVDCLVSGLIGEGDAVRQRKWAQFLSTCVLVGFSDIPDENRRIRASLVGRVPRQTSERVMTVLSSLARTEGPEFGKIAQELLQVWTEAGMEMRH